MSCVLRSVGSSAWRMQPPLVPKIIVFSQFFEFLDRVAIDLIEAKVKHKYFYGPQKAHNLVQFRVVPDIRVLLLSRSACNPLLLLLCGNGVVITYMVMI
jgi:SNF2 family DNA or RNA helicase